MPLTEADTHTERYRAYRAELEERLREAPSTRNTLITFYQIPAEIVDHALEELESLGLIVSGNLPNGKDDTRVYTWRKYPIPPINDDDHELRPTSHKRKRK